MTPKADFLVYSPDNKIELVVEVKTQTRTTDVWAAEMRRNLLMHAAVPLSEYFLLVMPTCLYLWHNKPSDEAVAADFKARTKDVLEPYARGWRLSDLAETNLELLVKSWLSDITESELSREAAPPSLSWLFDSGLYESIRHGHVEGEAVA